MSDVLSPDLKEWLESLNAEGVDYLLIGAYALAAYGTPRYTQDLDTWVRPDRGNAVRVMAAINRFGMAMKGLSEEDFVNPKLIVQFGNEPNRIDIITDVDGLTFDEAWATRGIGSVDGVEVPIPSIESLIKNKLASGRPKDLADVDALRKALAKMKAKAP